MGEFSFHGKKYIYPCKDVVDDLLPVAPGPILRTPQPPVGGPSGRTQPTGPILRPPPTFATLRGSGLRGSGSRGGSGRKTSGGALRDENK